MDKLKTALRELTKSRLRAFVFGYVKSVDKKKNTIAITEESTELVFENIVLSAGITIYPVVGSMAVACVVDGVDWDGFLVFANEFETIVLGGGNNAGMVKIKELTSKINALETEINNLKNILNTWVPVPQDGGTALKTAVTTWASQQIKLTEQTNIENNTITH
jgi:hypothetical protein